MADKSLTTRIEEEIARQTGQQVVVEETGAALLLSGRVDSPAARKAAEDIARQLAPGRPVTTNFEVEDVYPQSVTDVLPDDLDAANQPTESADNLPPDVEAIERAGADIEADFTDQELETTGIEDFAEPLPLDPETVDILDETENVVTPPTDPVITGGGKSTEVLGGFAATAPESMRVPRSASDGTYGDEAIAEAVREALQFDARTTDLPISVEVTDGVVYLRGHVPGPEDAESAEEVAARVDGVRDVRDELEVSAFD